MFYGIMANNKSSQAFTVALQHLISRGNVSKLNMNTLMKVNRSTRKLVLEYLLKPNIVRNMPNIQVVELYNKIPEARSIINRNAGLRNRVQITRQLLTAFKRLVNAKKELGKFPNAWKYKSNGTFTNRYTNVHQRWLNAHMNVSRLLHIVPRFGHFLPGLPFPNNSLIMNYTFSKAGIKHKDSYEHR